MSGNSIGTIFKVTTFGESHGEMLGAVIDGLPGGLIIDEDFIADEMRRRAPNSSKASTPRREPDRVEIVAGVFEGKTTGAPLALLIRNLDAHSEDYSKLKNIYRPGQGDFAWEHKFGWRDYRGGGRLSGRETAARVAAGAVAKILLAKFKVALSGAVVEIGGISAVKKDLDAAQKNPYLFADKSKLRLIDKLMDKTAKSGDSIGGVAEVRIAGCPVGVGEPVFEKLDAELAKAVMSVGAVKGVEFGVGFASAKLTGSEMNDAQTPKGGVSNNAGGIIGGISNGEEIILRCAIKPTPSIAKEQFARDRSGKIKKIGLSGRHDLCIAPRIVPVLEAMCAITIADLLLRQLSLEDFADNFSRKEHSDL